MAHYASARLVLKGFWGKVRDPLPVARTSKQSLIQAFKTQQFTNVVLLGDIGNQETTTDDGEKNELPAILSYKLIFRDTDNTTDNWLPVGSTDTTYFKQAPEQFQKGQGLGWAVQGAAGYFRSALDGPAGFPLLKNAGWCIRTMIPKPLATYPIYLIGAWDDWQMLLKNGQLYIMRITAAWTESDQTALHALEAVENPTTDQQNDIDEYIRTLYVDYKKLEFGEWYGLEHVKTLTLIPEPRGVVNITDGYRWHRVEHSDVVKTRRTGTVWDNSLLTVGSNSGAFYWQVGYPQFAPTGTIPFSQHRTQYWEDVFDQVTYTELAHYGGGALIPGTLIEYTNDVGMVWARYKATLTTTNTRYTPFFYAVNAFIPAGDRDADLTTHWDSDDYLNSAGDPPFLDISPSCEGEGRRKSFTINIMDIGGAVFSTLGQNYDSGAWRICDFYLGGTKIISNGIIRHAKLEGIKDLTYNQARGFVVDSVGVVTLTIADQWAVLDNTAIITCPIGDGLKVGGHIRQMLNLAGIPASEMSSVSASAGTPCNAAYVGEKWKAIPRAGQSIGDYLRAFLKKNAYQFVLYNDGTGWHYVRRSNSVRQIEGVDVDFIDGTFNPASYPGRLGIFERSDLEWDFEDYANRIRLIGAEQPNGEKLCKEYRMDAGTIPQNPGRLVFCGFEKTYLEESEEWTTGNEINGAARALSEVLFLPPRYGVLKSAFHNPLFPGDKAQRNGQPMRLTRAPSGSWQDDEMAIAYRELES